MLPYRSECLEVKKSQKGSVHECGRRDAGVGVINQGFVLLISVSCNKARRQSTFFGYSVLKNTLVEPQAQQVSI